MNKNVRVGSLFLIDVLATGKAFGSLWPVTGWGSSAFDRTYDAAVNPHSLSAR